MSMLDGSHARALREAQNLWDRDKRSEAIAVLEAVVPELWPRLFATDALVLGQLAMYMSDCGDPRGGLKVLEALSLPDNPRTDTQIICLSARCRCKAAAGNLAGARDDRTAIFRADPSHPALAAADDAIQAARRSVLSRATITRPVRAES